MSQENVEKVRRSNAAFNRRDRAAAVADYHPAIEWRDLQPAPDSPERLHGIAAVLGYWSQWNDAFAEFTAGIEEYIDAGDCVITLTHWHAKGKDSGLTIDQRTADVFEFADGKVICATVGYPDTEAALAATGREK
jgi:ketosteroid isomerase-like protein